MSVIGLSGLGPFVTIIVKPCKITDSASKSNPTWKKVELTVNAFFNGYYK